MASANDTDSHATGIGKQTPTQSACVEGELTLMILNMAMKLPEEMGGRMR